MLTRPPPGTLFVKDFVRNCMALFMHGSNELIKPFFNSEILNNNTTEKQQ